MKISDNRALGGWRLPSYVLISVVLPAALLTFFWQLITVARLNDKSIGFVVWTVSGIWTANAVARWLLLLRMRIPEHRIPESKWRVAVLTTYVPGSEPLEMIRRTLERLAAMDYPHDVWLLDEGNDPAAKEICSQTGTLHFTRRDMPKYQTEAGTFRRKTKHGNYNAWLAEVGFAKYDIVVGFDPDHVPCRRFLRSVLGYFDDDRVGYVQAPQAYYNQGASFIAAGAAEETYDFNSTIQMAAQGMGFPIVLGCHNSHRVTALKQVGGYAAHDADDLLISMLYRNAGWHGVYVPKILARGLTPVDWSGYLTQQRRWARSVLDLKLHYQPALARALSGSARLFSYVHGLNYLQPAFMLLLILGLVCRVVLTGTVPDFGRHPVWLLLLPGTLTVLYLFRQMYFLDPSREFGLHLRARLLRIAKAPFLLYALMDVLGKRNFGYVMTTKAGGSSHSSLLAVPFGTIACVILVCWMWGVYTVAPYSAGAHATGLIAVSFCLALIASEKVRFPEPYDDELCVSELCRCDGCLRAHPTESHISSGTVAS